MHTLQALHRQLGAAGSIRASCYLYNTVADIDKFVDVLEETLDFLSGTGDAGSDAFEGFA
jgi:cysteine desulfurase / selenocysteine lyase